MKKLITITMVVAILISGISASAASVPRESLPCNATEEQIIVTERLVGHIFDEVISGTGYADEPVIIGTSGENPVI